ncbi:MAG: RnfABCDGE type electron transport complex subunit D [Eubacterium sp.]|nr:RnfABCDGE type electron transport complex subunit D [Eubacterium sp.]
MSELINVSSNPHVRSKDTTSRIMAYVILALLPTTCVGIWNFGPRALLLICITIATCVASEYIFNKITHRKQTVGDLSAVVTGLLLALNFPVSLPWWMPIIGGVFAIIVVKMLFGGLGQNFMNPALGARCFMLISFTSAMSNFTYDGVSTATPLALMRSGESVDTMKMLLGTTAGTIGETSAIAIIIGAMLLILLGVIDLRIPGMYLLSFVVFIILFSGHGLDATYITGQLCGGGLMLGAFFMATDYATSPITSKGKYIYGILLGIMTGIFRTFGSMAEGVSYAIIFCNILVPLIERFTIPRGFGVVKEKKKKGGEA